MADFAKSFFNGLSSGSSGFGGDVLPSILYGKTDTDGGLFSGIDNIVTGNLDYARERELQDISNAFSASEAQKSRDFSEYMSSSAYQRAVADMKAAGINPVLAISNGGASVGSSAAASASSVHAGKSGQGLVSIIAGMLGGAFKVATTSMINEAQMAQTLARSNTAYEISQMNADARLLARRK